MDRVSQREMALIRLAETVTVGGNVPLAVRSARLAHVPWSKIAAVIGCSEQEARTWQHTNTRPS